jgi:hypothetical protein
MTPSFSIVRLRAYGGPNANGPQAGVLLHVRSNTDRSRRLKDALKDGAQFIGLVIGALKVEAAPARTDAGWLLSASFSTPDPQVGSELAFYVVAGMLAEARDDEAWDGDTPLFALQQRRRKQSYNASTLQRIAEARKRSLPVLALSDGRVQLGYGMRGWSFDPADLEPRHDEGNGAEEVVPRVPAPPWDDLGTVPLYVVTGEQRRRSVVEQVARQLQSQGILVRVLHDADYYATKALLADPSVECAVIGLDTGSIVRHGVAFTICTQSVITDRSGPLPASVADDDEWLRALGVPMLLSHAPAILNLSDPAVASLARYASHGVLPLDRQA